MDAGPPSGEGWAGARPGDRRGGRAAATGSGRPATHAAPWTGLRDSSIQSGSFVSTPTAGAKMAAKASRITARNMIVSVTVPFMVSSLNLLTNDAWWCRNGPTWHHYRTVRRRSSGSSRKFRMSKPKIRRRKGVETGRDAVWGCLRTRAGRSDSRSRWRYTVVATAAVDSRRVGEVTTTDGQLAHIVPVVRGTSTCWGAANST
jgi:hypothetical protein